MKQHILITGERGAGKSTLLWRLQRELCCPIYGFRTVREAADKTGFHPIYIHAAAEPREQYCFSQENLVGICNGRQHDVRIAAFDTLGAAYIDAAQPGGVIIMDELGFMEKEAENFKRAVLAALDGDIPVIAAVKARQDVDFLNEVRRHPKAVLVAVTPENREALFRQLHKAGEPDTKRK